MPEGADLSLTSAAFDDDGPLPDRFTCTGAGGSPPLTWSGVPEGTSSLALLVVDPDAPVEDGFTHWSLAGIDPEPGGVAEGEEPAGGAGQAWVPACPPTGEHRYVFTLYAFDDDGAPASGDRADIEAAVENAIGQASLTGLYQKP